MAAPTGLVAAVTGATGAVGEELVKQLVTNAAFRKVVTLGRRPVEGVPSGSAELVQVKVDMDRLEAEGAEAVKGVDVFFCALGTTRAVAGSAEAYKKVDYDYVAASARLAKAAGAKQFSVVTAQGANAKVPANDWGLFHGLLYMKTKGLAEQAAIDQGFTRTSIFRPGMLDRGDKVRAGAEKIALGIMTSIKTKDVARLMILDALRDPSACRPVMRFEMGALLKAAKQEGVAPEAAK
ncbi:hypothetical protein HYH03_006888 [Edaphochlamys debaryana]|uniref:NAD(P)-binding domain-containing protein n=1 Tax=Edaphochlamys debaryana TaxID=47281 RepID=A0A836C0W2_9CHLO|nr:hypothetical protein HYH03_006888 [Edaphochlamys debaryana]|eukprot:KAG2494953.1 hypothetical protein HYH03_006888 [Edaphochlamys debaryana]